MTYYEDDPKGPEGQDGGWDDANTQLSSLAGYLSAYAGRYLLRSIYEITEQTNRKVGEILMNIELLYCGPERDDDDDWGDE